MDNVDGDVDVDGYPRKKWTPKKKLIIFAKIL